MERKDEIKQKEETKTDRLFRSGTFKWAMDRVSKLKIIPIVLHK